MNYDNYDDYKKPELYIYAVIAVGLFLFFGQFFLGLD
jgi:hypothetical protein